MELPALPELPAKEILDAVSISVVVSDPNLPDSPLVYVNPAFEKATGYSSEEVLGHNCKFLQGSDRDQPALEGLREALEEGGYWSGILRNYRKSGEMFYNEVSISPVRDVEGRLTHFIGVQRDVSERVEAEEEAARYGRELSTIFESITDAFFALDKEWRFIYMNSEAERVLLSKREDVLGKNLWEEFPAAKELSFYPQYHKTKWGWSVGGGVTVEFEAYYPPLEIWVEVKAYPSELGISVYFRDITERKRAEREREESEERLRSVLVQYGSDIITIIDSNANITYESPAIEYTLGYGAEDRIGNSALELIHPDDAERVYGELAKLIKEGGSSSPVEYRIRHADGSWRYFESVGNNLLGEVGVEGVVINSRDITERKQVEQRNRALLKASPDLMFRVSREGVFLDFQSNDNEALYAPPEQIIGGSVYSLLPSGIASDVLYHTDQTLWTGEMQFYEYQLPTAGEIRVFESRFVVSGIDEVLCIVRDITERKRAEEEIQRLNEDLEERVEQRTEELRATVKKHERSIAREAILREASAALVAAPDRERICAAALEAVLPFVDEAPGTRVSIWSGSSDHDTCVGASGDRAAEIEGRDTYIRDFPDRLRLPLLEGRAVDIGPEEAAGLRHAFGFETKLGSLFMVPLLVRGEFEGRIAVASDSDLPAEIQNALETLGAQVALALERADLIQDLYERQGEERCRALIQNSSDIIVILDENGAVSYVSPTVERELGYTPEEFVRGDVLAFVHPDDAPRMREFLDGITGCPDGVSSPELRIRHADGSCRYVELRGNDLLDEPAVEGIVVNIRDVTERRRAKEVLRGSEERYRSLAEATFEGIIVSESGVILEANVSGAELVGYEVSEMVGKSVSDLVAPEYQEDVRQSMATGSETPYEIEVLRKDGTRLEVEVRGKGYHYRGHSARISAIRDISRQKTLERQLRHQALHDPLTGLPNRTLFNDRLTKALERTSRSGESVAVMFLDLDDFKSINDSLGHSIGDELLVSVAERLGECLRPSDTVSRMGGDEFTILLDAVDGKVEASQIAQRIVDRFHSPITISDGGLEREVSVTTSVGVVLEAPGVDSGVTAEELLKWADVALYRAKDSGRDHYLFFHPEMEERSVERPSVEGE